MTKKDLRDVLTLAVFWLGICMIVVLLVASYVKIAPRYEVKYNGIWWCEDYYYSDVLQSTFYVDCNNGADSFYALMMQPKDYDIAYPVIFTTNEEFYDADKLPPSDHDTAIWPGSRLSVAAW